EAMKETDVLLNHGEVEPPDHCEAEGKHEADTSPKDEVNVLPTRQEDYEIQLLEEAELSVSHDYGPMLEQELEAMKENLNECQDKGFIQKSTAPVLVSEEPGGGLQLFQPVKRAALPLTYNYPPMSEQELD